MQEERNTFRTRAMRRKLQERRMKRQRMMIAGVVLLLICLIYIGVNVQQELAGKKNGSIVSKKGEHRVVRIRTKDHDKLKDALTACCGTFLASKSEAVPAAGTKKAGESFAKWILREYPEQAKYDLLKRVKNGVLTEQELYESIGETLHVLDDRRNGYLKDASTAAARGIYMQNGKKKGEAEVVIAGDLCLEEDGFVIDHYDEVNDLRQCISPEILDITTKTDVFYLNHEYSMSDRGEPLNGKYYTFRAKPERMELLKEMGTDLVTLANNHVYDYGEEALLDTCDYLEAAGIPYVGGGRKKEEAVRPAYFIINGMKIGFTAASEAEKIRLTPAATETSAGVMEAYDMTEYYEIVKKASKECDYLIAYVHWGPEDETQYAEYQTEQGKKLFECGADIVVGGHPHVLQGIEYVDGRPIVYSMGDFWFNHETKYTGLLKLNITVDGLKEMSFVPCQQTGYTTQYLRETDAQREMYDFLQNLSPNAVIGNDGVIREKGNI